jgi:hypothetical protein
MTVTPMTMSSLPREDSKRGSSKLRCVTVTQQAWQLPVACCREHVGS